MSKSNKELVQNYLSNYSSKNDFFLKTFFPRIKVILISNEKCVFEIIVKKEDCNDGGSVFGGLIASIIDIISTSTDMTISFLLPVKAGETIVCESYVYKIGKSLANIHTIIKEKSSGKIVASGQHTKFNDQLNKL
ncbi:9620_t:CDS:2 [Diversispora eburnea]|uniref:9620_t:CDS:1 n=1 Tax=Diversispora eburnea TaxID=1213867 RepID=A0A9N9FHB4_9GLOM|nr:9620_t:CDS:2 [Diversispora eburnea]